MESFDECFYSVMCFVRGPSAIFVLNVEFFLLFSSSLVGPKWALSLIFSCEVVYVSL